MMKTIGVLGGLGPQATMDFEARMHTVAQQLIAQYGNSGYPPIVVYCLVPDPKTGKPHVMLGMIASFTVQ